jgi:hypothetical protein
VGDLGRADIAASARFVLDNDGLPKRRSKLVADEAGNNVGSAAPAEWHNHLDRA